MLLSAEPQKMQALHLTMDACPMEADGWWRGWSRQVVKLIYIWGMKKQLLLISLLCLILFSSCETYIQLYHLESKTVKKENDTFIFENDTLKITYSFWGNRGVLAFEIYNKLAKPIYVDWKKSSFIYKDQKLNFWVETETEISSGVYKNYHY